MKVYSWNILFQNKEFDRAFAFIRKLDFDVLALQECPQEFLDRLKTLPLHLAYRPDVDRVFTHNTQRNYVVIASRHPIEHDGDFAFPDYHPQLPLRTRIFIWAMRPFGFSQIKNRSGVYADLAIPGFEKPVRVFNMHLVLAHPSWRALEFEHALEHRNPELPTIVCGDFNILESSHVTILNWLLAGHVSDVVHFRRERVKIEERFVAHELTNPLRGSITHPFSRSQLDHILVSKHFSVAHADVLTDRIGSDHNPVFVETRTAN